MLVKHKVFISTVNISEAFRFYEVGMHFWNFCVYSCVKCIERNLFLYCV